MMNLTALLADLREKRERATAGEWTEDIYTEYSPYSNTIHHREMFGLKEAGGLYVIRFDDEVWPIRCGS